jgi:hypothetical protein
MTGLHFFKRLLSSVFTPLKKILTFPFAVTYKLNFTFF